jgi:PAS domain S-box-containing protein
MDLCAQRSLTIPGATFCINTSRLKWKHCRVSQYCDRYQRTQKIEEQQRIITERLNDAQHIACIGNWELDILTNKLYWSDEIFNLFEINPDNVTLTYETFINAVHPEDRDQVNQAYSNSIKTRIPYDTTHRLLMPDGRIKWMQERCRTDYNSKGEPIRSRGTVQDVTMQKNMEISLAQFASIVTSSEDAIISKSLNGIITSWNPAAERIFGYQAHEVLDHTVAMLLPPDRINEDSQILARIACGEYVDHFESIRIHKDGTPINISASISPLRDSNGNVIGSSQIIRDITKAKATETALIEAKLEADAANKAKSNFLANMSHEIRTPLNGILGMIQLVMNDGLKPQQNNYLHKAYTSSTALLGILNDILDYSKIEAGRLEIEHIPIKIEALLSKVSDLFLMQIEEKGLEIFFNIDPDVPSEILGDPIRLAQVLNNLVGNAIKFTERGEINIHISLESITSKTTILQFDIQDTGIGIDPKHSDLLFKPFSQSDNSITRKFGGTGLGLSISQKLIKLMGGEISVTSTLGQGSTFSFTITAELCHNHIKKFNSTALNHRKVLVIDDHETSCRILESWLIAWGIDVHTTTSGEQALHLIEKAVRDGYPFDTILLDWTMPGMSGLKVAQWIDEKFQPPENVHPMTIVMVTSHGMESVQNLSDSIHIDGILEKPVIPSDLFNSLHGNEPSVKNNPISNAQSNTSSLRFDGACILLVEDNTINQEVATTFLKKRGVEVTVANNGGEAIDWVQRKTFDAILMDVHMPVMDGFEATRHICNLFPDKKLPIIAMTAAVMQEDRDHCSAAGMVDFIVKPINPDELALCLDKWVKIDNTQRITNINKNNGVKKTNATFPIPSENIPGFDFVQALARMDGNYELLARMLQFFAEAQTSTQEKLDEYLRTEAFNEAILLLHNLRGSASTIGAMELADTAHQLENELKSGAAPQSHPAFEKALQTTIDIIRSMNSIDGANTVIPTESDVGRKDLYNLLKILTPYLRDGELIPDTQIQALYELSHRTISAHSLTRLIYHIEQFDHKAALVSIAELIPALEMEMSND